MIILRAIFEKGAPRFSFSTGFIRHLDQLSSMLQNVVLVPVFDVLNASLCQNPLFWISEPLGQVSACHGRLRERGGGD